MRWPWQPKPVDPALIARDEHLKSLMSEVAYLREMLAAKITPRQHVEPEPTVYTVPALGTSSGVKVARAQPGSGPEQPMMLRGGRYGLRDYSTAQVESPIHPNDGPREPIKE